MPGLNGTGPMGMGPMTGGARGFCNPNAQPLSRSSFRPWAVGGRGRGRGFRNMFWATGLPGRVRNFRFGFGRAPSYGQYGREQEIAFLKDQAMALKEELGAIDSRLNELDSESKSVE